MDRYEEALERAKAGKPLDEVFPELKESESEDERVRKEIVKFVATVKDIAKSGRNSWAVRKEDVEMCERFLAYLEKQKDERELSFIEGKMEGVRQTCQEIKDAMSLFEPKDLTPFEFTFRDYIDSAIRYCLAGEGYQQYIKEWAADLLNLEKQKEQRPTPIFKIGDMVCDTNHNRQPVYRIVSMDRKCYICESNDQSLGDRAVVHFGFDNPYLRLVEQKPAEWNDADMNEARNNLISVCRDWECGKKTTLLPIVAIRARYFLEHITEPKPAEWSEFDKGALKDAICAADRLGNDESFNKSNPNLAKAFRVAKDWLKSLPERFTLQPEQEVVDRTVFDRIADILRWCDLPIGCPIEDFKQSESEREHLLHIVQCVAHRYANSCTYCKEYSRGYQDGLSVPHWKPSERQIAALEWQIKNTYDGSWQRKESESLYNDLKSL